MANLQKSYKQHDEAIIQIEASSNLLKTIVCSIFENDSISYPSQLTQETIDTYIQNENVSITL